MAKWEPVSNHPNVTGLREAFVSSEWEGSPSLYFSHDYHPAAVTLEQAHILPTHTQQGMLRCAGAGQWCRVLARMGRQPPAWPACLRAARLRPLPSVDACLCCPLRSCSLADA